MICYDERELFDNSSYYNNNDFQMNCCHVNAVKLRRQPHRMTIGDGWMDGYGCVHCVDRWLRRRRRGEEGEDEDEDEDDDDIGHILPRLKFTLMGL